MWSRKEGGEGRRSEQKRAEERRREEKGVGGSMALHQQFSYPSAPIYLDSRLLGYVTRGCIEPSSHYVGNWEP